MSILNKLREKAYENNSVHDYFNMWMYLFEQEFWYCLLDEKGDLLLKEGNQGKYYALFFTDLVEVQNFNNKQEQQFQIAKVQPIKAFNVLEKHIFHKGSYTTVIFNLKDDNQYDLEIPMFDFEKLCKIIKYNQKRKLDLPIEFQVQDRNVNWIENVGGLAFKGLPPFSLGSIRNQEEIAKRVLCMYAVFQITRGAPTSTIREWLVNNKLHVHLSEDEVAFLLMREQDMTEQELIDYHWYIEGIWTGLWTLGIVPKLNAQEIIDGRWVVKYLPKIWEDESPDRFFSLIKERDILEIYQEQDRYYRLHWWVVDERIKQESDYNVDVKDKNGEVLLGSRIVERRRFLTWIIDTKRDWDNVSMST